VAEHRRVVARHGLAQPGNIGCQFAQPDVVAVYHGRELVELGGVLVHHENDLVQLAILLVKPISHATEAPVVSVKPIRDVVELAVVPRYRAGNLGEQLVDSRYIDPVAFVHRFRATDPPP
jgi:hypothetical protein